MMDQDIDQNRPSLLFDGNCGFCLRWVNWAKRRGADAAVSFTPCQAAVEIRQIAGISEMQCEHSAFLVECEGERLKSVRPAAAAINGVLARLPGGRNVAWRALAKLYVVPGIRQLEEMGYRVVARNRHRIGSSRCQVK